MLPDHATIRHAMATAGVLGHGALAGALAAFEEIGLSSEERLSAVASAVAAAAAKRHWPERDTFIALLRELTQPGAGIAGGERRGATVPLRTARVAEGALLLDAAFDGLEIRLAEAEIGGETRRLVESVMFARLLAGHRAQSVRVALLAVARSLVRADYRPGEILAVTMQPLAVAPAA